MKNTLIVVVIVIIAIAAGAYIYTNKTSAPPAQSTQTQNQIITQTPSGTAAEVPVANDQLLAGGNSYLDKNNIFSILYPTDYVQDMDGENVTRFYKRGDSQRPQSEMTDGVIVTIQTEPLNGMTLEQKVDDAIKQSTAGGMAELTSPKAPVTVNNQQGFTYKIRGLGESTYVALQKNDNPQNAVTVVYAVMGEKQQEYQQQVDSMLSTLQILK
jgi:multidrug resistance efflux pump